MRRASPRVMRACATLAAAIALSACGGSFAWLPDSQIELTATGTANTASVQRGDTATFTFTVANPGKDTVDSVEADALPGGYLKVQSVTCTSGGAPCPTQPGATAGSQPLFRMPPGAVFTFVVKATNAGDLDGAATMTLDVVSYARLGDVRATAQTTSVDSRDGQYGLFTAGGLTPLATLNLKAGAPSLATPSSTPIAGGGAMTAQFDYFTLSGGGHLSTGPDLLVGSNDFGRGQDTFIGARRFVTAVSDLDGQTFATFTLTRNAPASLSIRQGAIAGTTLTLCTDALGALATCSTAGLRHYTLSLAAGSGIFTASDSVHADTFTFRVARSGSSLIWLRDTPADATFSIGFAATQALAEEHEAYTTLNGKFGVLVVAPTFWEFLAQNPAGDFGPSAVFPFTGNGNAGIPGLLHGPRPSDGVEVYMLHQGPLTLVGTLAGEFAIALDKP